MDPDFEICPNLDLDPDPDPSSFTVTVTILKKWEFLKIIFFTCTKIVEHEEKFSVKVMVIFVSQSSHFPLLLIVWIHSTGFKLYQVYFCCFWPKAHQKQQNRGILKAKTIMFFCIGLDLKQGWFLVDKFLYYLFQENHAGETAAGRG